MREKPYIEVTGIATQEDAKQVISGFKRAGISMEKSHIPMAGVLSSHEPENTYTSDWRYPRPERLRGIFEDLSKLGIAALHYDSKNPKGFAEKLYPILRPLYEKGLCKGLQINVHSPDKGQVKKIASSFPELEIILPLTRNGLKIATGSEEYEPIRVADYIRPYYDFISYVLVDPSLGKGGELNANVYADIYAVIDEQFPEVCTILAGSFDHNNVHSRIRNLMDYIGSGFGIDAQSGLRSQVRPKGITDSQFNKNKHKYTLFAPERANEYLRNAARAFGV
ncbi:MAG: hypothetical protein JW727_01100 [Candidatus Aenigmarchaeota archaeon]|nr:hypothetical protein [Candidatus Aenigmarchaeota archaeon]